MTTSLLPSGTYSKYMQKSHWISKPFAKSEGTIGIPRRHLARDQENLSKLEESYGSSTVFSKLLIGVMTLLLKSRNGPESMQASPQGRSLKARETPNDFPNEPSKMVNN